MRTAAINRRWSRARATRRHWPLTPTPAISGHWRRIATASATISRPTFCSASSRAGSMAGPTPISASTRSPASPASPPTRSKRRSPQPVVHRAFLAARPGLLRGRPVPGGIQRQPVCRAQRVGDQCLLPGSVPLNLGRGAFNPQILGRKTKAGAVVEGDLQQLFCLFEAQLDRPARRSARAHPSSLKRAARAWPASRRRADAALRRPA